MPDRVQAASPDVIGVSSRGSWSGMETTVTPIQSTVVSGGPQARGNATMIKLESKVIRKRKKGEGGRERKFPCGSRAWPAGQGAAWKRRGSAGGGRRLPEHGLPRTA